MLAQFTGAEKRAGVKETKESAANFIKSAFIFLSEKYLTFPPSHPLNVFSKNLKEAFSRKDYHHFLKKSNRRSLQRVNDLPLLISQAFQRHLFKRNRFSTLRLDKPGFFDDVDYSFFKKRYSYVFPHNPSTSVRKNPSNYFFLRHGCAFKQ